MDKVGKGGEGERIRLGLRPLWKEDMEIIEHHLGHGYFLDTRHTGRMQKTSQGGDRKITTECNA